MVTSENENPPLTVRAALEDLIGSLSLDEIGQVRAATARVLAAKLDEADGLDTGAAAMATAQVSRELRAVLEALTGAVGASDLLDSIFGGDDD